MMVKDPEKVSSIHGESLLFTQMLLFFCVSIFYVQWVDEIASAGADQFTFHIEATGKTF